MSKIIKPGINWYVYLFLINNTYFDMFHYAYTLHWYLSMYLELSRLQSLHWHCILKQTEFQNEKTYYRRKCRRKSNLKLNCSYLSLLPITCSYLEHNTSVLDFPQLCNLNQLQYSATQYQSWSMLPLEKSFHWLTILKEKFLLPLVNLSTNFQRICSTT